MRPGLDHAYNIGMTTTCSFGSHPATNIKIEIERTWDDEAGAEVETKVELPICRPCNEAHYDGTEEHPRLRRLA